MKNIKFESCTTWAGVEGWQEVVPHELLPDGNWNVLWRGSLFVVDNLKIIQK